MATVKTPSKPYAVRHSKIHGRGVFATRKIRKGAQIIEYRGRRIAWDDALKQPDTDPDNPFHLAGAGNDSAPGSAVATFINKALAGQPARDFIPPSRKTAYEGIR